MSALIRYGEPLIYVSGCQKIWRAPNPAKNLQNGIKGAPVRPVDAWKCTVNARVHLFARCVHSEGLAGQRCGEAVGRDAAMAGSRKEMGYGG